MRARGSSLKRRVLLRGGGGLQGVAELHAGVEMLVKSDGRAYTFNVKTDSIIPDDMCTPSSPRSRSIARRL